MHDDESYLRQALREGAAGYVLKRAADSELIAAIRAVMRGEIYVHPSLTRSLLDDILPAATENSGNPWDLLSEREREVLLLVARGHTSAKIAETLNLSQIEAANAYGIGVSKAQGEVNGLVGGKQILVNLAYASEV